MGWEATLADRLRRARRPIRTDPRLVPRDPTGGGFPAVDRSDFPAARHAATLLVVYPGEHGDLCVPLTVRHADLRAHAGEVSLPGGAVDPSDADRQATALREAHEEIGLDPRSVRVAGRLDDLWIPVSNYELRPFVATATSRPVLTPFDAEVTAIVELPLSVLFDEAAFAIEEFAVGERQLRTGVYRHAGLRIWGATARTLSMLATVVGGGET